MGLLDRFRKNPLDRLSLRELMEEEIRLKNQIERLKKEIERFEKAKKKKFEEGIGADKLTKKMLAQEIKQLDMEAKLNLRRFETLYKQYTFVSNLLTIKKYERQLKESKMWDKITSISPEVLESALIKIQLKGKTFDSVLEDLINVLRIEAREVEIAEDEDEKRIFDAWRSVESGERSLEEVKKEISVENEIKEL
jgi:hypothetical protein